MLPLLIGLLFVPPGLASASDSRSGAVPELIGPIADTATSHMFDVSTVDLAGHGYVEQEYFQKGTANVYDYDSAGKVVTVTGGAPYENRIIVRRPANGRAFSGTVV